jgi:hypothetical protein
MVVPVLDLPEAIIRATATDWAPPKLIDKASVA